MSRQRELGPELNRAAGGAVGGVQLYMVRRTRRPRVIVVSQSQHARITAKNFDLVLTAQRHLVHPSGAQSIRDKWPVHGEQDSIDTKLHHRAEQCHPLEERAADIPLPLHRCITDRDRLRG